MLSQRFRSAYILVTCSEWIMGSKFLPKGLLNSAEEGRGTKGWTLEPDMLQWEIQHRHLTTRGIGHWTELPRASYWVQYWGDWGRFFPNIWCSPHPCLSFGPREADSPIHSVGLGNSPAVSLLALLHGPAGFYGHPPGASLQPERCSGASIHSSWEG